MAKFALSSLMVLSSASLVDARCYNNGRACVPHRSFFDTHFVQNTFNPITDLFTYPVITQFNSLFHQLNNEIVESQAPSVRYDIREDEAHFELALEVPGIKAEDLSLELQKSDETLKISGSRKFTKNNEMYSSKFEEVFKLDSKADSNNISSSLSDGILLVSVPKKSAKPEKISITFSNKNEDIVVNEEPSTASEQKVDVGEEMITDELEITEEEDI